MPVPPTYNGQQIFGIVRRMPTADNPRDRQINAYPALDGIEVLDGGFRGRVTRVEGTLFGANEAALVSAESAFRALYDGNAYTLTDTLGVSWPAPVRMENFSPADQFFTNTDGSCFRDYTAEFLHLG